MNKTSGTLKSELTKFEVRSNSDDYSSQHQAQHVRVSATVLFNDKVGHEIGHRLRQPGKETIHKSVAAELIAAHCYPVITDVQYAPVHYVCVRVSGCCATVGNGFVYSNWCQFSRTLKFIF